MSEEKTITHEDAEANGVVLCEFVWSDYDWDGYIVYKVGRRYAYFTDSGCSCNWAWEDMSETSMLITKKELMGLAKTWAKSEDYYDSEKKTGQWLLENL